MINFGGMTFVHRLIISRGGMTSNNSSTKPSCFNSEVINYDICNVVKNDHFVPSRQVNDLLVDKPRNLWTHRINKKCTTI